MSMFNFRAELEKRRKMLGQKPMGGTPPASSPDQINWGAATFDNRAAIQRQVQPPMPQNGYDFTTQGFSDRRPNASGTPQVRRFPPMEDTRRMPPNPMSPSATPVARVQAAQQAAPTPRPIPQNPLQTSPVNYQQTAAAAPAPAAQPGADEYNPREELKALLAERAKYARSIGADAARAGDATIRGYNKAINEVKMQLAEGNRARNLGRASQFTRDDMIAKGRSLDAQLPEAMAAGNQVATESVLAQIQARQRYGLPTGELENRMLGLAQEPTAPMNPNFFAQRGSMFDQKAMKNRATEASERAQAMRDNPSAGLAGLRKRGYQTQEQVDADTLAQAMRNAAIREVEMSGGVDQYDDAYAQLLNLQPGTKLTPEMRAMAQRRMIQQTGSMDLQAAAESDIQTQQIAEQWANASPAMAPLAAGAVSAIASAATSGAIVNYKDVQAIRAFWSDVAKLPPEQQVAIKRAVMAELRNKGIDPALLTRRVQNVPETGLLADTSPDVMAMLALRETYRNLYGGETSNQVGSIGG